MMRVVREHHDSFLTYTSCTVLRRAEGRAVHATGNLGRRERKCARETKGIAFVVVVNTMQAKLRSIKVKQTK